MRWVRPQSFLSGEAGHERELQALAQSCNIREGASGPRTGKRSNLETDGRFSLLIQVAKSILLVVSALFPIVGFDRRALRSFWLLTRDYAAETRRVLARRIAVDSFILLIARFTSARTCSLSLGFRSRSCRSAAADRDFNRVGDAHPERHERSRLSQGDGHLRGML